LTIAGLLFVIFNALLVDMNSFDCARRHLDDGAGRVLFFCERAAICYCAHEAPRARRNQKGAPLKKF
jgi:hypothetical protein